MADNTAELLAELNKALAENRVTLAEYSERTKNIANIRAQREQDRRACPATLLSLGYRV